MLNIQSLSFQNGDQCLIHFNDLMAFYDPDGPTPNNTKHLDTTLEFDFAALETYVGFILCVVPRGRIGFDGWTNRDSHTMVDHQSIDIRLILRCTIGH